MIGTRWLYPALALVTWVFTFRDALSAMRQAYEWLPLALMAGIVLLALPLLLVRGRLQMHSALLAYFVGVVVLTALSVFDHGEVFAPVIGGVMLIFFFLFWVMVLSLDPGFPIARFLDLNSWLSAIVSVLGIYQFYVDQTLFGIVRTLYSTLQPNVTQRAVSVFGTPQFLGIYLALNVAYLLTRKKTPWVYAIIALNIFVMFLSGSKSVSVFFIAYFAVFLLLVRIRWAHVIVGVVFLIATVVAFTYSGLVQRAFGPVFMIMSGQGDARVDIWLSFVEEKPTLKNIAIGHGVGTAERILKDRYGYGRGTAESYVVKVYYETGLVGLILFLGVYAAATLRAARHRPELAPVLAGFATNLVAVHTFAGLFMAFFFSAHLVYALVAVPQAVSHRTIPSRG